MTTSIQVLSNQNYHIGKIINTELQRANNVQIAVAFLKYSGVQYIDDSLKRCLDNGGSVELIAGLDFKSTDPKSIDYFVKLKKQYSKAKFYCFGDKKEHKNDMVFHPKMYLFESAQEKTSIVGSANLTKGGLTSNLEVCAIFTEKRPRYYSQFQAIYNSVKFTESVFSPDEKYLAGYSDVFGKYAKNEEKAIKDKGLQRTIKEMQAIEKTLPGTLPSIKSLIIEIMKHKLGNGQEFVSLKELYIELEDIVTKDEKLNFKIDTFRNNIRGEINHNLVGGKDRDRNQRLFIRSKEHSGFYALSEIGKNYQGR